MRSTIAVSLYLYWSITISILAALPSSSSFAMANDYCTTEAAESGAVGCRSDLARDDVDSGGAFVVEATTSTGIGGLWHRHLETISSTMDEARRILSSSVPFGDNDGHDVRTLAITAGRQTAGRGTTSRAWLSSRRGNALFTIAVRQSAWSALPSGVPLTLLPLKVGALVAGAVERYLANCSHQPLRENAGERGRPPRVTVKWPNDVLVNEEKIAGILIESATSSSLTTSAPEYWYLIGIGVNAGYAPTVPTEGANRGRRATSLSRYCAARPALDEFTADDGESTADGPANGASDAATEKSEEDKGDDDEYWAGEARQLSLDVAKDLHSWLHADHTQQSIQADPWHHTQNHRTKPMSVADTILSVWKSYVDWDMELTLRDTEKREEVRLVDVLPDGRVEVVEVETGFRRTLVADYLL